ncbi:hypothetical protein GCM10009663_09880 [Kitasatospora arboriphila]|uniref:Uncharacterized protein n=1 Tax=Kitasatospora arboriphila TaxID=258052 RepID=A0ABN1TDH8_9ACTN
MTTGPPYSGVIGRLAMVLASPEHRIIGSVLSSHTLADAVDGTAQAIASAAPSTAALRRTRRQAFVMVRLPPCRPPRRDGRRIEAGGYPSAAAPHRPPGR